jgi:predicted nucleic acid-binding protein
VGIIVDTSIIIEVEKLGRQLDRLVAGRESEPFGLSVISVAELLHGVHRADSERRKRKRSAFVEAIIEMFPIYSFDVQTARAYAEIWSDLSRKGISIGAHDLIIGSTAIAKGFSVLTLNARHFELIEGLSVESP